MGKHLDLDINQIREYWETTSLSIQEIADKMEHYISVDNLSLPSYEKLFFNIDY